MYLEQNTIHDVDLNVSTYSMMSIISTMTVMFKKKKSMGKSCGNLCLGGALWELYTNVELKLVMMSEITSLYIVRVKVGVSSLL